MPSRLRFCWFALCVALLLGCIVATARGDASVHTMLLAMIATLGAAQFSPWKHP